MKDNKKIKQPVSNDKKLRFNSLIIDGTKYRTFYNHKFENRKEFKVHDPYRIISYIPGTIVRVVAKEGQEVHRGDTVLILEAMKMKNRLLIEKHGIIKSIHVTEGEKVPKNYLMIELDPYTGKH